MTESSALGMVTDASFSMSNIEGETNLDPIMSRLTQLAASIDVSVRDGLSLQDYQRAQAVLSSVNTALKILGATLT